MSVSPTAYWRSWRRFSVAQLASALRLRLAAACVRKGWYPGPERTQATASPVRFPFRLEAAEQFDGADFRIDGKRIPWTRPMDWGASQHSTLTGIRLRSWSWLRTEGLSPDIALPVLTDFIAAEPRMPWRADPYGLSLRIQHAVWWLRFHSRSEPLLDRYIADAAARLRWLTEEHLANNHLLENGFALCRAGLHLDDERSYRHGRAILRSQLPRQLLGCGAQVEQSPMYQHVLLAQIIELIASLRGSAHARDAAFLEPYATAMAGWLEYLRWSDGGFPVVNDSVARPSPSFDALKEAMHTLRLYPRAPDVQGPQWMWKQGRIACCMDVGGMEPAHCPGHAHSDALQVLLQVDGHAVLVDPGTSTYEAGARRDLERAVYWHNTVNAREEDPAELLGAFRLGHAPQVKLLNVSVNEIEAEVVGRFSHRRQLALNPHGLRIIDEVSTSSTCIACFLVDKFCAPVLMDGMLTSKFVTIRFAGAERIELTDFNFATDFDRFREGVAVKVEFHGRLETLIECKG